MARFIDADKYVCAFVFDEEHEEQRTETMTIEDFLDRFTEEGCPTQFEVRNGELISRQAIIAEFACCELTPDGGIDVNYALDFIKELPSVQPRKGKWTRREDGMLPIICECSVCGFDTTNFELFSFCPICGSRMGEGDSDDNH